MGRSSKKGEEAAAAAPPVILRWQDLGELPKHEVIVKAPRDDIPDPHPRGKGKGKGKGKAKETGNAKLANYIKLSEFFLACKICSNPDLHRTFQCPNLTPALKEHLKKERSMKLPKPGDPNNRGCYICLQEDHITIGCPYGWEYPRGAFVGPFAKIVCMCCGKETPHDGEPGYDYKANAILRPAYTYPTFKEQRLMAGLKP